MVRKSIKMKQLMDEKLVVGSGRCRRHIPSNKRMTGVVYDERMLEHKHEWSPAEQESPARMKRAYERCQQEGLIERCTMVPARHASEADLSLIHSREYIQLIKKSRNFTRPDLYELSGQYDGVFFNENTWNCASLAAGSLQHLTRLVVSGQLDNALAVVRPPGHHAMHSEACGYCIFNNVAIAAASFLNTPPKMLLDPANPSTSASPIAARNSGSLTSARKQKLKIADYGTAVVLDRILIVDWDVHHGQGTQYAFYNDKRVLFMSIHRHEKAKFWPNLREADFDFVGAAEARGYNINIPLNDTGMCDSDYLAIFHNLIMPVAMEFNPQLVIVSCGFDAAIGCPEGRMWLSPAVFGHFVHHLKMLAGGRLVISMEGGYYVDSLTEGVVHVLKALLGDPVTPIRLNRPPCKSVRRTIDSCITALRGYWKSLHVQGISRSINRPNISHLSPFTWALVRRVVWPDTNPVMPVSLMEHIDRLLRDHLPGPVPLASQQTLLLLLPVLSPSGLAKTEGGQLVKRQHQQSQQASAWSLGLILQLSKLMQVNFYCCTEQTAGSGQSKNRKLEKTGSPMQKRKHTAVIPSMPDQLPYSTKCQKRSDDCSALDRGPDALTEGNVECGRQYQYKKPDNRWHPKKAMDQTEVDFKGALRQAVLDLITIKFSRLLILTERLNLSHLVDAIATVPVNLLVSHRKHMLRPRAEPSSRSCCQSSAAVNSGMNSSSHTTTISILHSSKKTDDDDDDDDDWILSPTTDIDRQCENQRKLTKQVDQLKELVSLNNYMMDTMAFLRTATPSAPQHQTVSQYLTPMHQPNIARLFVVDLNGTQQPLEPTDTTAERFPLDGMVQCDVTWCSIWCTSDTHCKGGRVPATALRALPLRTSSGLAWKHCLCSGHWLQFPLFAEKNPSSSVATNSGMPIVGDLISLVVRLLLPIAYEYAPDLVFLQVPSHWLEESSPVRLGVAHVIHLLNGLGTPSLINCSHLDSFARHPPVPCQLLLDVLLGKPQLPLLGSLCPTENTQVMLRDAMRANSHRWKCLKFAGNLVEWR